MTDNTKPEALGLADWLEAVGGGPSAKRCAALLREQHARIAELESELEAVGAGGVSGPLVSQPQAMPDLPAGWKAVPVNPTPEMWKAAKSVPDPNPPYPPHYGLVWDALLAASPTPKAAQHQTYRCKIKSRKQIYKEIPKDQQGWWVVAAGQKLLLRPAVQADIDRCHLSGCRSKNPDDYMCETQTDGSLVSKIALEYMNPEENVFAAIPAPPTSAEGVEHG